MTQIITWNINCLHCGGPFIYNHVCPPLRVTFVLLPASNFVMWNGGNMFEFTVKCFIVLDPFLRSGNLLAPGCIQNQLYPDMLQLGAKPGSCQADPRQRSIVVQITDQCPECGPNHMDMQALTWAKVSCHKSLSLYKIKMTMLSHFPDDVLMLYVIAKFPQIWFSWFISLLWIYIKKAHTDHISQHTCDTGLTYLCQCRLPKAPVLEK